jgi:putative metalloprotease
MLRLTPIILAVVYGLVMYRISVWRTHRELDARSTELADAKLRRLTDRMAAALEIERIPVFIYEVDPVNGLAAPDGRIFITRGFYRKYQNGEVSEAELASVIAHELGHVALGHAKKRVIDFSGQNALRTALLAKAGIGLEPQKSLFLKLEALTQSRAGMAPAWLMSHPKTAERIAALERLEAGWKNS